MTTTHRLVHGMNSFMYKWKNRYPEVQAQIDEERELMRAPDEADMTAQKSLTASEHSDQENAETDPPLMTGPPKTSAFADMAHAGQAAQPM